MLNSVISSLSLTTRSPTAEEEKGLRASVGTESPRLLDYGSPGRCELGSLPGARGDHDIIRFFTAHDILDLINNLQKSAKIASEEAITVQGDEQANRVKAKCSKICGLANRLIDLYVATIKAKVARILRKLGLGQAKGQELLYQHLTTLQAVVDKAFAFFNAVQCAEAARIRNAKPGVESRRDSPAGVAWRALATPPDQKLLPFRPGSLDSFPQLAHHLDVKDLLLEVQKQFLLMAEELVDLKNIIATLDRARIHDAVVAAVAEGDVPDPLATVKPASDDIPYAYDTCYISEGGGFSSSVAFGRRCTPFRFPREAGPRVLGATRSSSPRCYVGETFSAAASPLSPRREAAAFGLTTSRFLSPRLELGRGSLPGSSHLSFHDEEAAQELSSFSSFIPRREERASTCTAAMALSPRSESGVQELTATQSFSPGRQADSPDFTSAPPLSPLRETMASQMPDSPRTSRLIHSSFDVSLQSTNSSEASPRSQAMDLQRSTMLSHTGHCSVSLPGDAAGSQPWSSCNSSKNSHDDFKPRSCNVISYAGDEDSTKQGDAVSRQATARDLYLGNDLAIQPGGPAEMGEVKAQGGLEGFATCHVVRVNLVPKPSSQGHVGDDSGIESAAGDGSAGALRAGSHLAAPSLQPPPTAECYQHGSATELHTSDGDDTVLEDRAAAQQGSSHLQHDLQAQTNTLEMLSSPGATVDQQLVHVTLETDDGGQTLRKLALEALRLGEGEPQAMDSSFAALSMSRSQLEAAVSRCRARDASGPDLQAMLQGMLNATEIELEGLRIEHENLRTKSEMQSTKLRQLQIELSGLRNARDKLLEELQAMQTQRAAGKVKDSSLLDLEGCRTPDNKAATRAPSRGITGAARAGALSSKSGRRTLSASLDSAISRTSRPGVVHGAGQMTFDTMKSKETRSQGLHDSYSISPTIVRLLSSSMAAKPGWKCGIPQSPGRVKPGSIVRRSASSSKTEITTREHYSAVARLEEVEVQLAQAETARHTLEHKLQAAQAVIANKDRELDTANIMLRGYEWRSAIANSPAYKQAFRVSSSANFPLTEFMSGRMSDAGGDALALLAVAPSRHSFGNGAAGNGALIIPNGTAPGHVDLIARLEELQVQCEDLICRAADLDTQRRQAEQDASERALELQAAKEYIQELEEEAELLRQISEEAKRRMQAKEQDMAAQAQALFDAREALARARKECDDQISTVEAQAAQLEAAKAQLKVAQARVSELEARNEEHSHADADTLVRLRERVTLLLSQYSASRAALAEANRELAVAQSVAIASDKAAAEHRQAVEELRLQISEKEATRLELAQRLSAAEDAQTKLAAELAAAVECRQHLSAQLATITEACEDMTAKLASKDVALAGVLSRLEQCESSRQNLEMQLQAESAARDDAWTTLANMKVEYADLQIQVTNDQTAVQDLSGKLAETERARVELGERFKISNSACEHLQQQLMSAQEACCNQQATLASTLEARAQVEVELGRFRAELEVTAAKLATTGAARDSAYCNAVTAHLAQQELQVQLVRADTKERQLAEQVSDLEQQLRRAQAEECAVQARASALATERAAGAEDAVETLQTALLDVQMQLEAVRSEAAVHVATLEAKLAQTATEQHRLEMQVATAAAHSLMLEEEVNRVKAQNVLLEEDLAATSFEVAAQTVKAAFQEDDVAEAKPLNSEQENQLAAAELEAQINAARVQCTEQASHFAGQASSLEAQLVEARASVQQHAQLYASTIRDKEKQIIEATGLSSAQAELYHEHVKDLEAKLAGARMAINEHAARSSTQVEALEVQLATSRAASALQAEQSAAQVAGLLEQLVAVHTDLAQQAHSSTAWATYLETQLATARSAVVELVERSALTVRDMLRLEVDHTTVVAAAEQAAEKVANLEAQLLVAQSKHAELAHRCASQVQELEAQLVAALAENIEQAKRSAVQTEEFELQLAAAMATAMASKQAQLELSAQLEASRAVLSKQAEHSSADTSVVANHLEAVHADITTRMEQSSMRAAALEQQLSAARAESKKLLVHSATQTAVLEAKISGAQTQHVAYNEESAAEIAEMGKQVTAVRTDIANQLKHFSARAAALDEQVLEAHKQYATHSEHSVVQTRELEALLATAQTTNISEQVQSLAHQAAALEVKLATARAETAHQLSCSAARMAEQKDVLTTTRAELIAETQRHSSRVAELEERLAASQADIERQASHASALMGTFEERVISAREGCAPQAEQIAALEAEARCVVFTCGAANASHERQVEDVLQLNLAGAQQTKQLDLRQPKVQQLKDAAAGILTVLKVCEATVAGHEQQLESARQLEAEVESVVQLQVGVDRLQMDTPAAKADSCAASEAAVAAAGQQQANLAVAAQERSRLHSLLVDIMSIVSSQSRRIFGMRDEVATLQTVQDAAGVQLREAREHPIRQDAIVTELCREFLLRQQARVDPDRDSALANDQSGQEATELASLESAEEEMAWHCAELQCSALTQAETKLAAAKYAASEAQAQQRTAEEAVFMLQALKAAFEALASGSPPVDSGALEESVAMTPELAAAEKLLEMQRRASKGLLDDLTARLTAADGNLREATARVAEMQAQLANSTRTVTAVEQAASTTDMAKRLVQKQLTTAVTESEDGRVIRIMLQQLTHELARYNEEVERVRMILVEKQALLDKHESGQQQPQGRPEDELQRGSKPAKSAAELEQQLDAELAEDFLQGFIWGMSLGSGAGGLGALLQGRQMVERT